MLGGWLRLIDDLGDDFGDDNGMIFDIFGRLQRICIQYRAIWPILCGSAWRTFGLLKKGVVLGILLASGSS